MPLIPFVAGGDLVSAELNAALDAVQVTKLLFANVTVNNTTAFTTATDLTIPVAANVWYALDMFIRYDSGTTPDIAIQLSGPSGTFLGVSPQGAPTSATLTTNSLQQNMVTGTGQVSFTLGGAGAGTSITATPRGYVSPAGTAGVLTVAVAQAVANASNTSLIQGCWVKLSRVA
ncbi:MAG: hypothetical protein ACRDQZ_20845 [Mycobacteriales bacterium]